MAERPVTFADIVGHMRAHGEFEHDEIAPCALPDPPPVCERRRPNGTILEVRARRLSDGGAVRAFTDITDRKNSEIALAEARDASEAASRARSRFLAMMSHEIRIPMNGVIGMTGLLIASGLDAEQQQFAATLRESAEHLLGIINDVLDFSKLDAGRMAFEEISFDLRHLVESTVQILAPRAHAKGLDIAVVCAPDLPATVVGDPGRLRQVLLSLIGNGVKFTEQGGVEVTVEAAGSRPDGRVEIRFAVRDTGIGIPADAIGLLFREFSQLDNSVSRRFGGTGLGLAICKRLVDLMGGSVAIESEVGKGSVVRFSVWLGRGGAAEPHGTAPLSLARLRVAVVGGGTLLGEAMQRQLRWIGADARCAGTADEIGPAATRAIRALPAPARDVHIVALTANAFRQDQDVCRAAGMNDFLAKPITRDTLEQVIARYLDGRAPRPEAAAEDAPASVAFDPAVFEAFSAAFGSDDASDVLRAFITDAEQRIEALRAAARDGQPATVRHEAHALKSSAATFGFGRLSGLSHDLEACAETVPADDVAGRIEAIAAAYSEVGRLVRDRKIAA